MLAVGGDFEAAFASCIDAVQLHELLDALLAHSDAACKQFLPNAWPAVGTHDSGRGWLCYGPAARHRLSGGAGRYWPCARSVRGSRSHSPQAPGAVSAADVN
jgi:hypothetical protein